MKPTIWKRELECKHSRDTMINFMMANYDKPKIGDNCFCRECCSESIVINVKEVKREGNEEYYKWNEDFRDKCSQTTGDKNNE